MLNKQKYIDDVIRYQKIIDTLVYDFNKKLITDERYKNLCTMLYSNNNEDIELAIEIINLKAYGTKI